MEDPDLIGVASALYREKGRRLTVSDIARAAKVSRPTVYQRLGTKAQILERLAEEGHGAARPQDVEARIMAAVLAEAAHVGFAALTVEGVAERGEVGVATIFRRYGSKEDLLRTFASRHAPRTILVGGDIGETRGLAGLSGIASALLGFMRDNRDLVRLVVSGSVEDRRYLERLRTDTDGGLAVIAAFFDRQNVQGRLQTDLSAEDLARNLFGLCHAQVVIAGEAPDHERALEAVVSMFRPFFAEPR